MLHSLTFSNFFSFKEETTISFEMDGRAASNDKSTASLATEKRLSKIIAVVGANAAGKTNVIKPLAFLSWFICNSVTLEPDSPTYVDAHFLTEDEPSTFNLEFELGDRLFKYSLELNSNQVIREHLSEKTSRQWSYVFLRSWSDEEQSYKYRQKHFGLDARMATKAKRNCSLISYASQQDIPLARNLIEYFSKFHTNINSIGRTRSKAFHDLMEGTLFFEKYEQYKTLMCKHLEKWDLGLSGVDIEKIAHIDDDGKEHMLPIPFGLHKIDGVEYRLPLMAESSGTQSAFVLLSRLLPVLRQGGVMVYDELESDLHPHMLESILELFFNPRTNPHSAQIVFTTHSIELLNSLQKCQILLVEKNECVSEAWKLSEMAGVRSDDNFYAKYMAGTYGAVPQI